MISRGKCSHDVNDAVLDFKSTVGIIFIFLNNGMIGQSNP